MTRVETVEVSVLAVEYSPSKDEILVTIPTPDEGGVGYVTLYFDADKCPPVQPGMIITLQLHYND